MRHLCQLLLGAAAAFASGCVTLEQACEDAEQAYLQCTLLETEVDESSCIAGVENAGEPAECLVRCYAEQFRRSRCDEYVENDGPCQQECGYPFRLLNVVWGNGEGEF